MALLPEQQQRVLNLRHACGYTNEEIEEITGLNSVNVRVALSRGRSKIRELFKEYENG
ncbi:MAG: sigma-70 region 4 domain-containing protein [Prevotellaceae bacterium]|nr:sigma-70 region 4 domain-containing protein [Prevotellaceae bacterium]